jgi:predicted aldo/keto reductase-like oxidoreductase
MRVRTLVLVWLAVSALVGFFVAAPNFYLNLIGLDASGFLFGEVIQRVLGSVVPGLTNAAGGMVWAFGSLLAVSLSGFFLERATVRRHGAGADAERRRFLAGAASGAGLALGSALAGGLGLVARAVLGIGQPGIGWLPVGAGINAEVPKTHPEWRQDWHGSRVRSYRRLGRTEVRVSDISLGASRILGDQGERIVREALERGVTYVDTAPDYSAEGSEEAIGRAIRGRRDRLFLATKFCTPIGHLPAGTPVARYKDVVEASLRRLGTDHVDLVHIHACDELDRLLDPNVHEAFDRLRQEGKARFLGFSSHTPNLVQVANTAIDSGRFDVMMLAYHHGVWGEMPDVIARARRQADMGVVAMKTLKGAKHHGLAGFREEADAYSQAAFKWVLSNPDVSCLVVSFFEPQHVDEYLHASGRAPTARDHAILRRYDERILGSYCSPHCGECLEHCPHGVPIAEVLRHRMYFEDYGWEKEGMRLYARLERQADVCTGCPAPCAGSCPVGIPIQERLSGAHRLLTFA